MGDPHNKNRYGEIWPQVRIEAYLEELLPLREHVVLSGGWAWHFMSPKGHVEYKHAHDHKDLDLMVPPEKVQVVMELLQSQGFEKAPTQYDNLPSKESFRRYEKAVEREGEEFKITIDFFVNSVPTIECEGGWSVVHPATLLTFYRDIHSSDKCWAVQGALKLLANDEPVVGRRELMGPFAGFYQ